MSKFKEGDLVIVVDPTSDYFMNEVVEILYTSGDMIKVRLIKAIKGYYKVGNEFSWYERRVRLASECNKCKHACKMKEPCGLYEE